MYVYMLPAGNVKDVGIIMIHYDHSRATLMQLIVAIVPSLLALSQQKLISKYHTVLTFT